MNLRLLKKIIKPLQEPTKLEKSAYKISKISLIVTSASMVISILGIVLIMKQIRDSADRTQFQNLLSKQDRILKRDSILIDLQADLYNLNADLSNQTKVDFLNKKFRSYNELASYIVELKLYTDLYKDQRNGSIVIKNPSAIERLKRMDAIYEVMKKMNDVIDLIPSNKIRISYEECINRLIQGKFIYNKNIALGATYDTSIEGSKSYDTIIYRIVDFADQVMPNIENGRIVTERNINQLDSVIQVNAKIKDSIKTFGHNPL